MRALKVLSLAALTALAGPAWANLTFTATGSYNLGSASGSVGTAIARTRDVEQQPEPMSAGLALTALLATAGARRRSIKR